MVKRATRFAVKFNQEHKKLKKNLPFYLLFRKRRTCVHVRDWKPTDWRVEALPYIYTARRRWWWKVPIGQLAVVGCYHSYNHNYTTLFLKIYQTFPSCSFLSPSCPKHQQTIMWSPLFYIFRIWLSYLFVTNYAQCAMNITIWSVSLRTLHPARSIDAIKLYLIK